LRAGEEKISGFVQSFELGLLWAVQISEAARWFLVVQIFAVVQLFLVVQIFVVFQLFLAVQIFVAV